MSLFKLYFRVGVAFGHSASTAEPQQNFVSQIRQTNIQLPTDYINDKGLIVPQSSTIFKSFTPCEAYINRRLLKRLKILLVVYVCEL